MPEVFANQVGDGVKKVHDVVVAEVKKMKEEGGFDGWWKGVIAQPESFKFESQHQDEVVLLLMRQHWITNWWWVVLTTFLLFVPVFWSEFPVMASVSQVVNFDLTVLWYMALGWFVIRNLLMWFYNVYIVTDERVIDVDFFGLLYKNVNVAQLIKIEDVNYSQAGILASIFNYGEVVIQTSSEQRSSDMFSPGSGSSSFERSAFTFTDVPNPDRVVKVIGELMDQEQVEVIEGRVR